MAGAEDPTQTQPSRWRIGPPAPGITAWLARAAYAGAFVLIAHWVRVHLGGVALAPKAGKDGSNDTSHLFNWHPLLMTFGFVVCMSEAVMAYRAPLNPDAPRPTRKTAHACLHASALLAALLGAIAVFKSHSLKRPTPMADLYSPHSHLGLLTLIASACQFALGLAAYVWPKWPLPDRMALGPLHRTAGLSVWLLGLAAVASGLQEKVTFIQMGAKLADADLYGPIVRLPAVALLLVAATAVLVGYHFASPAQRPRPEGVDLESHALLQTR